MYHHQCTNSNNNNNNNNNNENTITIITTSTHPQQRTDIIVPTATYHCMRGAQQEASMRENTQQSNWWGRGGEFREGVDGGSWMTMPSSTTATTKTMMGQQQYQQLNSSSSSHISDIYQFYTRQFWNIHHHQGHQIHPLWWWWGCCSVGGGGCNGNRGGWCCDDDRYVVWWLCGGLMTMTVLWGWADIWIHMFFILWHMISYVLLLHTKRTYEFICTNQNMKSYVS